LQKLGLSIRADAIDTIAPDGAGNPVVLMALKTLVRAAGGVISRRGKDGETEVLLIYRTRQSDWTFPKGKLEAGETFEKCALREVREETGLVCMLHEELPSVSYHDRKRQLKLVRYWAMTVLRGTARACNEVEAVRWFSVGGALTQLTYRFDQELLTAFSSKTEMRRLRYG
jgi:8-oxo-dGTP diphosphatase